MEKKYTVLIIDDDKSTNYLNKKILSLAFPNLCVIDFFDPELALDYTIQNYTSIDFMLLDINMPKLNGWQLLEVLYNRISPQELPKIVMLTSSVDEKDIIKSKEVNSKIGFITKPLKPEVLKKILPEFFKK
jgi:CheY-like chemotaxis protein